MKTVYPREFPPATRALALEPRLLYDAAAAAAVDHQQASQPAASTSHDSSPAPAAKNLLVIDSRINGAEALANSATPNTQVLQVAPGQDGVAAVQSALDRLGQVDSIQILGHGAPGQLTLGSSVLEAGAGDILRTSAWASHLSGNADILLYGCNTAQGQAGHALLQEMATLTGADIAASTNDTGAASAGGDWTLESSTGPIESKLQITDVARDSYQGLLADASPTLTLTGSSTDILLGSDATIHATMTNPSTQEGYAPFVDVLLPTTGYDGDDGVSFVSASALGINLVSHVVTFGADGTALHSLAKDAAGNAVVLHAADYGYKPGDQLVVLELPFAGFGKDQPAIDIDIKLHLSDLADVNKDNVVSVRSGFQYGNDALDNPTQDPSIFESSFDTYALRATPLIVSQDVNVAEGETVTGENFPHTLTVTATPAPGQTLDNVVVTQTLPDTIRVRDITPAAGGSISAITLADGTRLTGSVQIAAALASQPYLRSYTVTYATLSTPADTVITFFVPDSDFSGTAVLDPVSGDNRTITIAEPTVAGEWIPLDPRDVPSPLPLVPVFERGDSVDFVAKSITLRKTSGISNDTGTPGLSPGDTLQFQYDIALSDYFTFGQTVLGQGQLTVVDNLGDGMTFSGTPVMTFTQDGQSYVVPLVYSLGAKGAGGTVVTFDLAASIRNAGLTLGALAGDIASDGTQQAGTTATITYQAVVDQAYQTVYPQSEINEGDSISNSAVLTGTIVEGRVNLGDSESDDSTTTLTVPNGNFDLAVFQVNGVVVAPDYELHPGDIVTLRMSYDLQTGDYENLKLTAYLPLPLFDASGSWSVGVGDHQWLPSPNDDHPGTVQSVTAIAGDALVFDFGNYAISTDPSGQNHIEVLFTLRVSDQAFADQRNLTVVGQSTQTTTATQQVLTDQSIVLFQSVAEPVLAISHGVVASSGGTVTGTTGSWSAAGTGGAAFTGAITDAAAIDGTVNNMDAGDTVRLATVIENSGGGVAFDVSTAVTLPVGLDFVGGSLAAANLRISRGDGTLLQAGVDYSVSGATITFLDAGGQASLLAGRTGSSNENSGANLVVITYDTIASAGVKAGQNLQSTATLTHYASVDNGTDYTPVDPSAMADALVAAPVITKVFADGSLDDSDSSAAQTTGSNLVVGERMLYDLVVTLPEGNTQSLRVEDMIPAGMSLDTSFGSGGYQLITTVAGSSALSADFAGTVTVASLKGVGGAVGSDGTDIQLVFGASTALGNNINGDNSFVIRLALFADNVASNQAGALLTNDDRLLYSDPDGDIPNGSSAVDRTVTSTGTPPQVAIVEPSLTVSQVSTSSGSTAGVDRGDSLTYTITISNGSGSSDVNAYDVTALDTLPNELSDAQIVSVTLSGGASISGSGDFVLVDGVLQTAPGSKLDIPKGGAVVLQVSGTLNALTGTEGSIDNPITVQWTSLDGASTGERTGADGPLNGGSLNDYQVRDTHTDRVAAAATISHVGGLPDTVGGTPTTSDAEDVAVGEIVHYRVAFLVPEGTDPNAAIRVVLPDGLSFVNDGSAALAFVANSVGGVAGLQSSQSGLIVSGNPSIDVGIVNKGETLLQPDLSGASAQGVVNASNIDTSDPRAVVVQLGTLINADNDADYEAVFFDFNVRVDNTTAVTAGQQLAVKADFLSNGSVRTSTDIAVERVVEPRIDNLDKTVTAFDPGVSGSTGSASYSLTFSNSGGANAYNVVLTDTLPSGGQNLAVQDITIGGTLYTPGTLPAGVSLSVSGGLVTLTLDQLDAGKTVALTYTADLPNNVLLADTSATVTYTSLPDSFNSFAGTAVGGAGSSSGERIGAGTAPNSYLDSDAAGVSFVSGTLWNDTDSATSSSAADGPGIANQTVMLTWGGADNDLATVADNQSWTVTTNASGFYSFGVLGSGVFRIDAPSTIALAAPTGAVNVRIDSDGATPLDQVAFTTGDLGSATTGNVGYVERNDAPTNHLPSAPSVNEDTALPISGLSISDPDAGSAPIHVTLSVGNGALNMTLGNAIVVAGALGSGDVTLQGSQADLNTALSTLVYTPSANFNGNETLTIRTDDLGQRGDVDGDGIPFEAVDDNLSATDTLAITVIAVNDAPQGVADTAAATEAGGTANGAAGVDPQGNVLANDTDVDIATNQDVLAVTNIAFGSTSQSVAGSAVTLAGAYGSLTIDATGAYRYTVDNSNPTVDALLPTSAPLTEVFTYTVHDLDGAADTATLTVTIHGANDAPVAGDDFGSADEKGGTNNDTGGSTASDNGSTNVLANDTDIDTGDTRSVTLVRATLDGTTGPIQSVAVGSNSTTNGTIAVGRFGTLTIGADGTYNYVVDDNNATVQALNVNDTLVEKFDYAVADAAGLISVGHIQITVRGANDNPVAVDNVADGSTARVNAGVVVGTALNPSGNVITDEHDTNSSGQVDSDVDNDIANASLTRVVSSGTGSDQVISGAQVDVVGSYGTLKIDASGAYTFVIDSLNSALIALGPNDTAQENFTYTLRDQAGGESTATLTIVVHGVQDAPVAADITRVATEAGGVANGTLGLNPSGDVTVNDTDPDGDALTVTAVRTGQEAAGSGTSGTIDGTTLLVGEYGSLTLNSHGLFNYTLNNNNADVEALRTAGNTLTDYFTYTITDGTSSDSAELRIRIVGSNDAPVAVNDIGSATEAGGTNNAAAGQAATGNVLTNDTDPDSVTNGETRTVVGARAGIEGTDPVANSPGGAIVVVSANHYGTLTINPNGSYGYGIDNTNAAVQALASGQTITDTFSYKVRDAAGLTDIAELTITIHGANDAPVADNETAAAVEAGGTANGSGAVNPTGILLDAGDTDVDAGDTLSISAIRTGQESGNGTAGTIGGDLRGAYGVLHVDANGTYTYTVDNSLAAVQQLRLSSQTLIDYFTFTVSDSGGLSDKAQLTVTIAGNNDAPVAVPDSGTAIEAGGTSNDVAGQAASGNVLTNDTDVDAGDTRSVSVIQSGTVGGASAGAYGTLHLNTDGSYSYTVDDSLSSVQALNVGQSLTDTFNYTVRDTAGLTSSALLTITIQGRNDAPVAVDDVASATPATSTSAAIDATGTVLSNDTDVDVGDTKAVNGVRAGTEAGGGLLRPVGTTMRIDGEYGWLDIGPDGSYHYHADETNPLVAALAAGQNLLDHFTYRVVDGGGLTDLAQLTVTVVGVNDAPVADDVTAVAIEAGGVNNQLAGRNPAGDITSRDFDVEGRPITVTGIRTGPESGGGASTTGTIGVDLRGEYGTLKTQADGNLSYVLDNNLPAVQALRTPADRLTEAFTYTISDDQGAQDQATITIQILGQNDDPVAVADHADAVESGGRLNDSAGVNPTGNVFANDSDVDAGDSKTVTAIRTGELVAAGSNSNVHGDVNGATVGGYGTLTLRADGSYNYTVDNANPAVEALRNSGETLTDVFTYTLTDTAGAAAQAQLVVTIAGRNDSPVARDDVAAVDNIRGAPVTQGNVLPNDSDVDSGDRVTVVGIRTGGEAEAGQAETLGSRIAGKYGFLTLTADGSYNYEIDLSNPDVQAAHGRGKVLQDVFTYTVADLAGATDTAQLTITLELDADFVPSADPHAGFHDTGSSYAAPSLGSMLTLDPVVYVTPAVRDSLRFQQILNGHLKGEELALVLAPESTLISQADGLGQDPSVLLRPTLQALHELSHFDDARMRARHGNVSLSADGLLPDPSLFGDKYLQLRLPIPHHSHGTRASAPAKSAVIHPARSFSEQIAGFAARPATLIEGAANR